MEQNYAGLLLLVLPSLLVLLSSGCWYWYTHRATAAASNTAEGKARRLLDKHLTFMQRQMYRRWGYFYVQGSEGRYYKIKMPADNHGYNVSSEHESYCTYPTLDYGYPVDVPKSDLVLAQVLTLRADERSFRSRVRSRGY